MAMKLPSLILFLLLLGFQELMMTPGEAAICRTPSRLFSGLCFSHNNCESICVKEGFLFGECKMLKCICEKDCNAGGSAPGGEDPGQGPPGGDGGASAPGSGDPGQSPPEGDNGGSVPGVGNPGQGPAGGVGGVHAPGDGDPVPHAGSPHQSPSGGKARPPENGLGRSGSPCTGPPLKGLTGRKTQLPEF